MVANQPFFDLSQESLNQAKELVSFVQSKISGTPDAKVFIMGDFNAGPKGQNINSAFPDSYWYIRNSEFSDSQWLYDNMTGTPLECTYCNANPLTSVGIHNEIFDHIFISNASSICVQSVEVFAKENM
jgi:endonuclease/exonuclease/phosphatase family metal-dependent hydrolase